MIEQLGIPPSNFNGGNLLWYTNTVITKTGKIRTPGSIQLWPNVNIQMHESRSSKLLHVVIAFKAWQLDNNLLVDE